MDQRLTPKNKIITGYKATDENMCCRNFQFKLGKWYTHKGGLSLCGSGFHFCEYPSGPWAYYSTGRLFRVEAKEVLLSTGPGACLKHVARKIRLVEEIKVGGDRNTGDRNTGDENTGDGNTGHWNTGHWNAGNLNTGDGNTGHWNTGDRNTGHWNAGNRNTGDGNAGSFHSGCLNYGEAKFFIFNKEADRSVIDFSLVSQLCALLIQDDEIDPSAFLSLPNASPEEIKRLHEAHRAARSKASKTEQGR